MKKVYNKLVRDLIPSIIIADGKSCTTRVLSDDEFLEMLNLKLDEELLEYKESHSIEELTDMLEVIYTIIIAKGYTLNEAEQIRKTKLANNGGFSNRIFLLEVEE